MAGGSSTGRGALIDNDQLLASMRMLDMDATMSNQADSNIRQQQAFEAQQAQQARANAEQDANLWDQQDANTRLAYANAAIPQIDPMRRDAAEQLGNWKSYLAGVGDKMSPYQVNDLFREKEAQLAALNAQRQTLAQSGMNDFIYKKGPDGHDVIDQDATTRESAIRKQGISDTIATLSPTGNKIYSNIKAASDGNLTDPYILGVIGDSDKGESMVKWATDNGVSIPAADMETLGTRISHPELAGQAPAGQALGLHDPSSVFVYDPQKVQAYLADKSKGTLRPDGTKRSPIDQINDNNAEKEVQAQRQQNLENAKEAAEIRKTNAEAKNAEIMGGDASFTTPGTAQAQAGDTDNVVALKNAPAGSKPGDYVSVKLANGKTVLARVK